MTLNGLPSTLKHETIWLDAARYQDAERQYYEHIAQKKETVSSPVIKQTKCQQGTPLSSIGIEIANAREKIIKMLSGDTSTAEQDCFQLTERMKKMEAENAELSNKLSALTLKVQNLEGLMNKLSLSTNKNLDQENLKSADTSKQNGTAVADDDDEIDLFGSDEDDEEAQRLKEERVKAYAAKKAKKPALVAKSSVVLDVKPWDDEVNMKELEEAVRKIEMDGLKWGASKLVPVAYGVQKLQIIAIVEDEKVSIDGLQESIQENEDLVQSVDIAAFNKL